MLFLNFDYLDDFFHDIIETNFMPKRLTIRLIYCICAY